MESKGRNTSLQDFSVFGSFVGVPSLASDD